MKTSNGNPPEKICRLCLSDSGVILPIFDGEVAERFPVPLPQKIFSCLAIKVCADDPLPPHICHRCLYEVDRFHEFRETCKRTNTTFNKICNNSSDSVPFDVNQVLEIKQELHEESVYHDAINDLLSDEESVDILSSRARKRLRCRSLLDTMRRAQQAQSAANAEAVTAPPAPEEIPSEWTDQAKSTTGVSAASDIRPQFECRYCSRPFIYQTNLLKHEELHAKGLVEAEGAENPPDLITPEHEPMQNPNQISQQTHIHPQHPPQPQHAQPPQQPHNAQQTHALSQHIHQHSITPAQPHSQQPTDSTETVSLTDVTAMLLEGAFEGVRPSSSRPVNTCRYCGDQFNNSDMHRRHENLYCARKPSVLKLKKQMHHHHQHPRTQHQHQELSRQQVHSHQQDVVVIQQHHNTQPQPSHAPQPPPQPAPTQEAQQAQHPQHQMVSHKEPEGSSNNGMVRACKYCHKDFIHRGSLWRHQMFCDSNPDRELNRAVAGTRKKSFSCKNSDIGVGSQQQSEQTVATQVSVSGAVTNNPVAIRSIPVVTSRTTDVQSDTGQRDVIGAGSFKCKFCDKLFLHRGSWWRHQKMFCSRNPDIPTVKDAVKDRMDHQVFSCRYCDRTFLHRGSCWHHEQTHTGIREHACCYCSKTFSERSRVARHERMHLGIKPFACRQCGKAFCDASNLRNHEQIHGERAAYLCAWCGKSYTRRALLLKHEQVHAGEGEVYPCPTCPRTFPDPDTLHTHSLTHSERERRVFLCQTCGQTFRSQHLLSQHNEQVHLTVQRTQQRTQQQVQAQPQTQQQQLVQQVQHQVQQQVQQQKQAQQVQEQVDRHHPCSVCNKTFGDIISLRHHQLVHGTSQLPYVCPEAPCSAVFQERTQLDAHLVLHTNKKSHTVLTSTAAASSSAFHQQQQLLQQHELHHQHQQLHHHQLLPREGTYVLEGQTIAVHHLVGQLP